jgi:undecaprenyl-diphosphatase
MFSAFKTINQFAGRWRLIDIAGIFCAKWLILLMAVFLFAFYFLQNNLAIFFNCLSSGLLALALAWIICIFYKERRPAELQNSKVLIPVPKSLSFPSGHASVVFGLSLPLLFFDLKLAVVFIILSCFVSLARVFCGVHWFSDILGGALVGFFSSLIIYFLFL